MADSARSVVRRLGWKKLLFAATSGGAIGGFLHGTLLHHTFLIDSIGALYGASDGATTTVGWVAHMTYSIVFSVVFVAMLTSPTALDGLAELSDRASSQ